MYDENDNRYLDCVNNVTHGMCMPPLMYLEKFYYNVLIGKFLIPWRPWVLPYSKLCIFVTISNQPLFPLINPLRYQPPFRTVCARIAVALVVFIKTPINHIFFKSLIIPDFGFELTKTIYLNVFRNWNALCKSTRLYKSCSTPPEINGRKQLTPHSLLNTFH